MSSPSKKKGYNGEMQLVRYLEKLGFQAKRIVVGVDPSAGSVDVEGRLETDLYTFQVKWKSQSFNSIYKFYNKYRSYDGGVIRINIEGCLIDVSDSILPILSGAGTYQLPTMDQYKDKRTLNKILNMRKLVGKSQYLVIKGDHKPLLFIRFR